MDGENNGNPYEQIHDLGGFTPIIGNTHILEDTSTYIIVRGGTGRYLYIFGRFTICTIPSTNLTPDTGSAHESHTDNWPFIQVLEVLSVLIHAHDLMAILLAHHVTKELFFADRKSLQLFDII